MAASRTPSPPPLITEVQHADNWCYSKTRFVKCSYIWTIDNFSLLTVDKLNSSTFSAKDIDNLKWSLRLFPNNYNHLSLYIEAQSSNEEITQAKYTCSIINAQGEKTNVREVKAADRFVLGTLWGFSNFMYREYVLKEERGFLKDDNLTIFCEVEIRALPVNISGQFSSVQLKVRESQLSQDFGLLLKSEDFSDVVLSVGSREFPVHKTILGARSPVFAAMFRTDMIERKTSRVIISGMGHDVVCEVLRYIYTGEAVKVKEMAGELLNAADKYGLERLKELCLEAMHSNLCTENVANMLILADRHSADQLKTQAIEFINTHATDVLRTAGWKSLTVSHPQLVTQTFVVNSAPKNEKGV